MRTYPSVVMNSYFFANIVFSLIFDDMLTIIIVNSGILFSLENPIVPCVPSQNGLLLDAPHASA